MQAKNTLEQQAQDLMSANEEIQELRTELGDKIGLAESLQGAEKQKQELEEEVRELRAELQKNEEEFARIEVAMEQDKDDQTSNLAGQHLGFEIFFSLSSLCRCSCKKQPMARRLTETETFRKTSKVDGDRGESVP